MSQYLETLASVSSGAIPEVPKAKAGTVAPPSRLKVCAIDLHVQPVPPRHFTSERLPTSRCCTENNALLQIQVQGTHMR